jgi:hypothetical protein
MSSATAAAAVTTPLRSRSRLANKPFRLPNVDANSSEGRYFRDLCLQYATELGDPTTLGEAELTLVRTTAGLAVEAARLQSRVVRGETVDTEQLVRVNNALTRNLGTLRKKAKQPHGAVPSLQDYLAKRATEAAA